MAKRIELRGARRVTSARASFRRPAWSPDGRRLAVEAAGRGGALYLLDGKGRIEERIGEGGEAAWSPDGARLAFTRVGADGRRELWLCDASAASEAPRARRLAGGDGATWEHPAWAPDGARLVCASDAGVAGGLRHLWAIDPASPSDSGRARLTTDPQRSDGHPAWAPDGRAIAFDADDRSDDAREIDLYLLDLAAGRVTRLTDGTVATRRPAFLDQRHLVAERRSVAGPALVVLDLDRGRVAPIGDPPAPGSGERQPAVRRGKKGRVELAFVRRGEGERDAVWVADLRGVKLMSDAEAAEDALARATVALAGDRA